MLSSEKRELVIELLLNKLNCDLIYIFGSYAKNNERRNSDLDIAILTDIEIDKYDLFLLSQKLADKINCDVDLVDLKMATTVFKAQIIQGELVYCSDDNLKAKFELDTLRKYAKLNEEREEILQRVWGDK